MTESIDQPDVEVLPSRKHFENMTRALDELAEHSGHTPLQWDEISERNKFLASYSPAGRIHLSTPQPGEWTDHKELLIEETTMSISHEYMHHLIHQLESFELSKQYDFLLREMNTRDLVTYIRET